MKRMSDKNFIDSNIWLYALLDSKGDKRHQAAVSFLKDRDVHVISSQVIKETLSNLIKKANVSREYIKDLVDTWYLDCQVVETNKDQIVAATRLRGDYGFSFWDSFIVASAMDAKCDYLFSEDMQDGQIIDGILKIINPFKIPKLH